MRFVVLASVLLPALASGETRSVPVCADGSCKSVIQVDDQGKIRHFTTPQGLGATDLETMFDVDPTLGAGKTVAVVDAFGYQEIEADLAVYRQQYGLPACTVASGCLTILNSEGQTTPLAPDTDQMWIGETGLDVDMVSAACPLCNIVVVQAAGDGLDGLQIGQLVAAKLNVDAISDSWGGDEYQGVTDNEGDYNNAGIGTFVSSGDGGFAGGAEYPSTSAYAIAVGGTGIGSDGSAQAWILSQSGCSSQVPKQPWSPSVAPCPMRASADISAYADDRNPGIATYSLGTWTTVGGTSASSPFSAALFTAAGHGDARATFVYAHADAFTDVTQGSSGGCGSILCTGAVGWDGPTGLGTPDQGKLVAIGNMVGGGPTPMIGYPSDGATLMTGFTIQMGSGDTAVWTQVQIDGSNAARLATAGTTTAPLWVTDGSHTLTFTSYDQDHNSGSATITVTVGDDTSMMGGGGGGGCCSASGGGPSSLLLFAIGAFAMRRRRQS